MTISETTRRNIIGTIRSEGVSWNGSLDEVAFLSRIYDLDKLPSSDHRYDNARDDIWQHRVNNSDGPDDWIFNDERFNLLYCSDREFLRFLCEMIHPAVRSDRSEAENLLQLFNEKLGPEGYRIVEGKTRFGKIHYVPEGILPKAIGALEQVKDVAEDLNSEYLRREIVRMTSGVDNDPELAIGTSKEFLETICKTILKARNKPLKGDEDLPKLVYLTIEEIKPLTSVSLGSDAEKLIRKTIGVLYTLTQCIVELRNQYGTGHGKDKAAVILETRHAALAVNSAAALALFLYESYTKSPTSSEKDSRGTQVPKEA